MSILEFWKSNSQYWIPISENDKKIVDKIVYEQYYNYNVSEEPTIIGKVIYLDQFYRHFHRHLSITDEDTILNARIKAVNLVIENQHILKNLDEIELVFALMPFKHIGNFDFIFNIIYNEWQYSDKPIKDFPILSKFHNDTYKKEYTFLKIKNDLKLSNLHEFNYNPHTICDHYPKKYKEGNFGNSNIPEDMKNCLNNIENPIVSLSGGVDSMVILMLLKKLGKNPIAVHIIYGNREVSMEEFHFISKYCHLLEVPLNYYKIEWLKRNKVDREFYESMTRDIRFNVYKSIEIQDMSVILGHIRDDVIENIWTNISKCQHINHLKKMEYSEIQQGVRIVRPFLNIHKHFIYVLSKDMAIPYLKNTTPNWSNRGKFRDRFYNEIQCQFGKSVDDKIICFAECLQTQNKILKKLLYEPIYNSYNNNSINITPAIIGGIDKGSWIIIFEHICHNILGCSKPSSKAVDQFICRLYHSIEKNILKSQIVLKSNLKILLENMNNNWFIHFIQ